MNEKPLGRRVLVHHPALRIGEELSVRHRPGQLESVHLRQSDIDKACGQHAVLSALAILQQCTMAEILSTKRRKSGVVALVHEVLHSYWHAGVDAESLVDVLEQLPLEVNWATGQNRGVDSFLVNALLAGRLALLVQQPIIGGLAHWVLAVGASGLEKPEGLAVDTILCIDPSAEAPPPFAVGNATLRLTKPVHDWGRRRASVHWWNESWRGRSGTVVLEDAIALSVANNQRS